MSQTADVPEPTYAQPLQSTAAGAALAPSDPTDRPIPLWPEGMLAAAAGALLVVIALRHRTYLRRKAREVRSAVEEFQRQGGIEDLTQAAKQATEFFKSA